MWVRVTYLSLLTTPAFCPLAPTLVPALTGFTWNGGCDLVEGSQAKVQGGSLVNSPCLTQRPTKSWTVPTQRHITSEMSGKERRCKLVSGKTIVENANKKMLFATIK